MQKIKENGNLLLSKLRLKYTISLNRYQNPVESVDFCVDAVTFFDVLHFFCIFNERWNLTNEQLTDNCKVAKRLFDARWSAHADAASRSTSTTTSSKQLACIFSKTMSQVRGHVMRLSVCTTHWAC